jgi:hypothetical protein
MTRGSIGHLRSNVLANIITTFELGMAISESLQKERELNPFQNNYLHMIIKVVISYTQAGYNPANLYRQKGSHGSDTSSALREVSFP